MIAPSKKNPMILSWLTTSRRALESNSLLSGLPLLKLAEPFHIFLYVYHTFTLLQREVAGCGVIRQQGVDLQTRSAGPPGCKPVRSESIDQPSAA